MLKRPFMGDLHKFKLDIKKKETLFKRLFFRNYVARRHKWTSLLFKIS